jgi:hypothetical protein
VGHLAAIVFLNTVLDQREQAGRLLDLLLDGLRYRQPDVRRRRAAQT